MSCLCVRGLLGLRDLTERIGGTAVRRQSKENTCVPRRIGADALKVRRRFIDCCHGSRQGFR